MPSLHLQPFKNNGIERLVSDEAPSFALQKYRNQSRFDTDERQKEDEIGTYQVKNQTTITPPPLSETLRNDLEVQRNTGKIWLTPRSTYKQNEPLFVQPGKGKHLGIKQEWGFEDFVLKEAVGSGAFGEVFRAREVITGVTLALKVVRMEETKFPDHTWALTEEIRIHSQLSHPNICRLYGYFINMNYLVIVMEYCGGGTLHSEIQKQKNKCLNNEQAAKYIVQIARGVRTCHKHNIMHRDLKPENILLDREKQVKLTDFGWACTIENNQRRITHGGTTEFNAPEVVDEEKEYLYEAEVWSLGCVLYEMLYGQSAFVVCDSATHKGKTNGEDKILSLERKVNAILTIQPNYRHMHGTYVDPLLKALIKSCLQKDVRKRIKLNDIFQHPGIRTYAKCEQKVKK